MVIRSLADIDQQLIARFDSPIYLYSIARKQSRKFWGIMFAIFYSYTHFSYLIVGNTYFLIIPIVVNRMRCVQLSFYLEMVVMRLGSIYNELDNIRQTKQEDRFKEKCYENLVHLKAMFSDIWKIALLLNECFSWSIAAITSEIFLELTINSYLLYISMSTGSLSTVGLTIYCLGVMPTIVSFLLSCRSADYCTEMVTGRVFCVTFY